MASKKRGRKKKAGKKVVKKVTHRRKKVSVTPKASGRELILLERINKKVNRIDETVNAGFHLARKARHAKRRAGIEKAWEDVERHGME
jgi:hypothetical protein